MTERTRIGRYLLKRSLARGGAGEVWAAQDEQLLRPVAIKLMHSTEEDSRVRLERFEQEARLLARLQHPHVVQVYDYGLTDDDTPYIVMELLDGEDLAAILQRTRTMSVGALVPVVIQAAKGLHAAHRAGIIHQDLKPANLLLARRDGDQVLKILDFGIATMRPEQTLDEVTDPAFAGTPNYMSPEQVRTGTLSHRTDLWSLAVVVYEALTGVCPFAGDTILDTAGRILGQEPTPPSKLIESLGSAVDAFFERALAKEPAERFSSALEMAAAFSALERPRERTTSIILVVDDEPDLETLMRQRFRRQIRRGHLELLFAANGEDALAKLAARPDVDVVLTDINMPQMDGLTLLRRLSRAGPALRAVVLSAYGDMPNIRAAMNAGAFDFLTKPVDFSDLEVTLDKALRDASELRRALRSIEENDALRMFVDNTLMERLLPLLRVSSEVSGDTIDATIVSIDVWGVDRRIEKGPASAVFELLNRSFDIIVPIINSWQGVVMRFVGDAVLALFQGDDHLSRAASACFAVRAALSEAAHEAAREEPPEAGSDAQSEDTPREPAFGVCIGLDSGSVLSGSVGSRTIQRMDYTVLGNAVSGALAMERIADRGQILVRHSVAQKLAPTFESRSVGAPADELGEIFNLVRKSGPGRPERPAELSATVQVSD